jgi:mono/diheme cytochrome c family protein
MRRPILFSLGLIAMLSSVSRPDGVAPWRPLAVAAQQVVRSTDPSSLAPTTASDGRAMFAAYCAPCHGKDGKGGGPVGQSLKVKPTDLTKISARNGGTFPDVRIRRLIEGADTVFAHGDQEMPVWGPLFLRLAPNTPGLIDLRVNNLSNYLKAIQERQR